jgi:serine/threonine protein kinase
MPQPTPTPSPVRLLAPPSGNTGLDRVVAAGREARAAEQLAALHEATAGRLEVLALLGEESGESDGWGSVAYLTRDRETRELLAAALNERTGAIGGYDVTLWRELDESLPGPVSSCPSCGVAVDGWARLCSCGADLSGIAPGTEEEWRLLEEQFVQATVGELELIGTLPFAGSGGLAYFGRQIEAHRAVVALRMHADGTFDDGVQHISLSVSEPLGEMGVDASSVVGRSPHSGPIRFTPVDSISVVTDETAARPAVSGSQSQSNRSEEALDAPLRGSILGSGLLAQQPTPPEQEVVAVAKVCPQCAAEYDTASRFCPNDGTPLRPKGTTDPFVGRVLAERYHMLKRLGEGGMGKVYLAEHVKMNRQCAVKVMNSALLNDSESAQRFAREASNAARIIHPNVAAVFDYGESDGIVYLVMEYVDGEPVTRILERETVMTPNRAVDIARHVAEALVAAHELGIVHRDLKPDNIIIAPAKNGREIAKVVDFGIAKAVEEGPNESLTRTGLVIGTPEYMSPEQLLGDPVDARSDIYSLGCILYQMLTGRRPFDEPTREQMIKRRLTEKAPHPRDLVPSLPKTLDLVVARMLSRSPRDRYGTAAEVRDLLIPAIALEGGFDDPSWRPSTTRSNPTVYIQAAEQPTQEMTPYPGVLAQRPLLRRPAMLAVSAVGAVALLAGATVITRNALAERRAAQQVEQQAVKPSPSAVVVFTPPPPRAAELPSRPAGATAAARQADSSVPNLALRNRVVNVPAELQTPIEQLRGAIESRLDGNMREIYANYEQDEATRKFWPSLFKQADSIQVKAINYRASKTVGTTAEVSYTMTARVTYNNSKEPVEVPSTWKADLVREKPGAAWKIRQLSRSQVR